MDGSSIISSLNAGSGIDMAALASNLAEAQFGLRSERLASKRDLLERQISTASEIRNSLSQLASALGERMRFGDLSSAPTLANPAVADVKSPAGTSGSGSYSLEVTALARSQTWASTAFASSTDPVGAGQLVLRFGEVSGTGFTEDTSRAAVPIDIASGSSLTDIARQINGADTGVTAYVASTVDGPQLVLKGPEGATNGFVIEAVETVGEEGLSALAWNPSNGGAATQLKAQSADAAFKLDGLAMTSASNKTGQVAPGVELDLKGTNIGNPTTISFTDPTPNIASAMSDLVTAFNEVAGQLAQATNAQTGDLARDDGARALKRDFAGLAGQIIMPNAPETGVRTLADLGVATERDGTFRLDTTRLQETIKRDPEGVAAMFTTGLYGVYATIDKISRSASSTSNPGSLAGSIARYSKMSTQASEQATDLAEKQEALRAQIFGRLNKAEARITASQSTLTFLQAQIDAWNSTGNN